MKASPRRALILSLATAMAATDAAAVSLATDGLGQALIYPYYTVRTSAGGNAFNTYLSLVNHNTAAKALRVRVREGRAAKAVLDFNLYLGPNDVWAGAFVPTAGGAQLITPDTSCTDPAFAAGSGLPALSLHSNGYTGANADGFGDTLDRTREGYVEIIEMATLSGASAAAVAHNPAGMPNNCNAIRATATPSVGPPSGLLSGTLTLINVNSGQDFTLGATALQDLSTRTLFYPAGDSNPTFASNEIDPVSIVAVGGNVYRSVWARPQDAVSAVLMHSSWTGEFIMDNATRSLADVVVTLPTRLHYVTATTFEPPFTAAGAWNGGCADPAYPSWMRWRTLGEELRIWFYNREAQGAFATDSCSLDCRRPTLCAASAVASPHNAATHLPTFDLTASGSFALGSTTGGLGIGSQIPMSGSGYQNGWLEFLPEGARQPLTSLSLSTRTNIGTGQVEVGSHRFSGLPIVGFTVRTFSNGTLNCSGAGSCQGNYGGAFGFKSRRTITTAP